MATLTQTLLNTITERVKYPRWTDQTDVYSYGGKMFLNYRQAPVFAEIYALKLLEEDGYHGFWIDNYRRRLVTDMSLENKLGSIDPKLIDVIRDINEGKLFRSGTWDLCVWKDSQVVFVEMKKSGDDSIRKNQIHFFERAIQKGYNRRNFAIYEWSLAE